MKGKTDLYRVPLQEIHLKGIITAGYILDIGGGGEGLVSRIEGQRVCSVDISVNKLQQARLYGSEAQWIAADGRSLCFQEGVFSVATLWFSLGYLSDWSSKERMLAEVARVLRPKGTVSVLASRIDCQEERLLFNARFVFPDGDLSQVGYGVLGNQGQTLNSTRGALEELGFRVNQSTDNGHWFLLEATKVQS